MTRCALCGAFMKVEKYTYADSQGVTRQGTIYRCNNTRNVPHEDWD